MKSYLSLVPISAKVHRRQNRMTLLCIIFAVFLVTAICSMAHIMIKNESDHTKDIHGNWHINIKGLTEAEAEAIAARPDVAASSWYDAVNLDQDRAYRIDGRQAALCGIEDDFRTDIMYYFDNKQSVQHDNEVILTPNAEELLGVKKDDTVNLDTPSGRYAFRVTGFRSNESKYVGSNGGETTALLVEQKQIGVFMNINTLRKILADNHDKGEPVYYVQFNKHTNMKKAINEISAQCNLDSEDITQNSILMGLMGLSDNPLFQSMYPMVLILFLLILLAGVLMISGSLNSSIVQRAGFFGMMRCIGMSKRQVIRFVRLESLSWCKTAIPVGIVLGTVASWGISAVLRYVVGGEFSKIAVFHVSSIGIISGVLVGLLTVLVAAQSPARRASKVSPAAAVSGNAYNSGKVRRGMKTGILKVETSLGIFHATSSRKNLSLMSGSFALSIILFLCFSVLIELLGCMLPTKLSSPDLSIGSRDVSNSIEHELIREIGEMEGVENAFGRSLKSDVPAEFSVETEQNTVTLLSYDKLQLSWLQEDGDLRKGSDLQKVYGNSNYVLAIWDQDSPIDIGDKIQLYGSEVEVAGLLKCSPFTNSGSTGGEIDLICSEETFTRLTGEENFAIIDVQVTEDATDEDVAAIDKMAAQKCDPEIYEFRDRREEADRDTYWSFALFIYGFLAVIALIAVLNIVNSISMSVSAKIRQYGAMQAVGMDGLQVTKMIAAEALTYAFTGCIIGCVAGLPLSKLLYDVLITSHFPYETWSIPIQSLLIIVLFVVVAAAISVYAPSMRIRKLTVTDTINEL